MSRRLCCYSFHSVKGGVGKSTLSVVAAVALATKHPDVPVYLVDMDLTGTSLADVLPLAAPRWDGVEAHEAIDVRAQPHGFHDLRNSRARIEERSSLSAATSEVIGVPFLNDYLLFAPSPTDEGKDVPPGAVGWRLQGGPGNLLVLPSSALPRDLSRALPVIYDEDHAGFLEGRLEYLLAALLREATGVFVVFDTPPTIPGLSRSVMSLALRMSHEPKTALSTDGFMPSVLRDARVDWRAFLVATRDYQDIRAAARWLDLVGETDQSVVRLVMNRVAGDPIQNNELLQDALRDQAEEGRMRGAEDPEPIASLNPSLSSPIWIEEAAELQTIFRGERMPPVLHRVLLALDGQPR
jgi:NUBPL iron-transfer P-loop NTPase